MVDNPVYILAPIIGFIPALMAFAVIPFADKFTLFGREMQPFISDIMSD